MNIIGKPQKTPLYESHIESDAKIVDFSGWLLPVQFSGILKEHLHTRQFNSIFDICHMGEFLIEGKNAKTDLSRILTTNVEKMSPLSCRYGFILNEKATFIDDSILYKFTEEKYMLVVNAGRIEIDFAWLKKNISPGTILTDISSSTAKIDLQGPLSIKSASMIFDQVDFSAISKFTFTEFKYKNHNIIVSATGYTGELGFEFFIPYGIAEEIWKLMLAVDSIMPAGLGSRDSLRLEKGYSLYGHEINESINPYEASLEKFLSPGKTNIGSQALEVIEQKAVERKIVPFLCEGRRSARDGYDVYKDDLKIGFVTSGAFSPSLKRGIGLCMIDSDFIDIGNEIICKLDNIEINAVVSKLPFV